MGGLIFIFLLALVVVILITPALRARFGVTPPPAGDPPGQDTAHEVVIRRLDDHRARRTPPRDDAGDKKT